MRETINIGRGFRVSKAGKVERDPNYARDASAKKRRAAGGSKKVRVVRRGKR